ncbi:hypothetical protein Tco_0547579 [Tanacetum coccineum]
MFWHTARDDTMFTSMRCISRHEDTQVYGTILPKELTNQAMLESKAYQTYYAFASGEKAPKPKYIRKKVDSDTSPKKKPVQATKGITLKTLAKVAKSDKKKQPAKVPKAKGLNVLSEVALTEAEQMKLATKRSKTQFHNSHASGSGDGVDTYQDDEDAEEESDMNGDSDETESDNDGDDLTHPNLSTFKADKEGEEEEKADDEEVSSDLRVSTPPDYELTEEEEYKEDADKDKEGEQEEEEDDLYRYLNINLEISDAEMTDAQANQDTEDTYVTLTTVPLVVQQQNTLFNVPVSVAAEIPSSDTTIPQPPIPNIQPLHQTPTYTTTTTNPIMTLPKIPNFASLFQFDQRVFALESEMSEFRQTSQFAEAVSSIPGIVDTYLAFKMKEAVDVAVQLQTNKLREEAQAENQEFLNQIDSTMKAIIKEHVQAQVSKIMPKIEKYVTESLGAEVLVRSTNQPQTSYAVATSLSEFELKKILIDKMETNKSIDRLDTQKNLYNALVESYNTDKDIITSYDDVVILKRGRDDQDKDEDPSADQTEGRKEGNQAKKLSHQKTRKIRSLSPQVLQKVHLNLNQNLQASLLMQRIMIKRLLIWKINHIKSSTHEMRMYLLSVDGPIYHLIKGTRKSLVKLECHLEEVFKATNDRLDWHNPEGKPYPHDLNKPLQLILNEQGRQVIPLDHFINNDLEYLKGGCSSQKYTTSITKTKAADYGQVKWIEDKKFYGYASNIETSKDVYSRHKIIAVTSLKIMKWFSYSHLEEIIVRRQDDQLYKFREGDFKRLRRQDIEDMLLLLVQDKLTNLNLEERYALNVALRMFTRRIVIQERVEYLQLGVESYQKKINLKKPDTHRSNLRRMTPYTAYPDI